MSRKLSASEVRLYGIYLVLVVKTAAVLFFHLWSVSVGRRGLSPSVIGGGDDGDFYLRVAEQVARTGEVAQGLPNPWLWPGLIGRLMYYTGWQGTVPFKVVLFAASLGTAGVGVLLLRLLAADVLRARVPARVEVALSGLLILFPSTLMVTSYSIYRDAVIYFLAMTSVYFVYRVLVRREWRYWVPLAVSAWGLFEFRWYAAVAVGVGALLWFPLTGGRTRATMWKVGGVVATFATFGVAVQFGLLGAIQENLEVRDTFEVLGGGSNIGISYTGSSVFLWPLLYVYSFLSNAIGPLPNQINGLNTLMGFILEVPALLFVLSRVVKSRVSREPGPGLVLIIALCWFALIAIYNDNVGTALRLRIVGYQFLFVVAAFDAVYRARLRAARPRAGQVLSSAA